MRTQEAMLRKAVENLIGRAEECFDAAEAQRANTDKQEAAAAQQRAAATQGAIAEEQHASAENLVLLGEALVANAATLNGELEMLAQRPSYNAPAAVNPGTRTAAKSGYWVSGSSNAPRVDTAERLPAWPWHRQSSRAPRSSCARSKSSC